MVKRTHHTLLWLFAIFVAYLLIVRLVITWAQFAPGQFSSVLAGFTDSAIEFQALEIEQNWSGVVLRADRFKVEHEQFEFRARQAAVDLNLFATLWPRASWGDYLEAKEAVLLELSAPAQTLPSDETGLTQAIFSAEHLVGEVDISRLWRRVNVDRFLISTYQKGVPLKVAIDHFQAFKGAHWSMAADFGISYGQVLQDESFQLKGSFLPNVWGGIEQGSLSISSFKPLRIENLASLLPAKWRQVLPTGELNLEINGKIGGGLVTDLDLELYAQAMRWPDRKALLPKTMGVKLAWQNQRQVRDGEAVNWRFSANQIQMDNQFIQTVAPIELYLASDRNLHFATQKFDIRPFKKMVHSVLKNEKIADLFSASVTLALENIEGKLNIETLVLEELSLEIDKLAIPVTHLPGIAMEQVLLDKRGTDFQVIIDKPVWVMEPRVHPVPMRIELQNRLNGKLYALQHSWRLNPLKLTWDQMPLKLSGNGNFSGNLDARLQIAPGSMQKLKQYLPYTIMSDKLHSWLQTALVEGQNIHGDFFFKGNLNDYPFETGETTFGGHAMVEEAHLKFQPDWPALQGFNAELNFSPYKLEIVSPTVSLEKGLDAESVRVVIDHLNKTDIAVAVSGQVNGSAQAATQYLLNTPLPAKVELDALLSDAQKLRLQGAVSVDLDEIWIPVGGYERQDERVRGRVKMADSALSVYDSLEVTALKGELAFTEQSVEGKNLRGRIAGGDVAFVVTTDPDAERILVGAKGEARSIHESLFIGKVPWQGEVVIPLGREDQSPLDINVKADTSHVEWVAPIPFDETQPGNQVEVKLQVGSEKARVYGSVDRLGAFNLLFDEGRWKPNALRGLVQFGGNALEGRPLPEKALRVIGRVNTLDLDRWRHWKALQPNGEEEEAPDWSKWLSALRWGASSLEFDRVLLWEESYPALNISWQSVPDEEVALKLDADYLEAVAKYRQKEGVAIQLSRLNLHYSTQETETEIDGQVVEQVLADCKAESASPGNWPKVTFVGTGIRINDIGVKNLQFQLQENRDVLHFKNLKAVFADRAGVLTGEYFFHKKAKQSSASLTLTSEDVESLTRLVGLKQGFTGKSASIKSNIAWPGGPECFSLHALTGRTKYQAKDGVLKDVEPGFARLLGLLNVTSIARRLSLDLKDVTTKGMAYDKIEGESQFKQGKMILDGFKLTAPSASLKLKGDIDMIRRRFNLKADVTPALGGSLPALSAITGVASPLAALAVYALMKVLPDINEELITYQYKVTGPWAKPDIDPKNGQQDEPQVAPSVDELLNID